MLNMAEQIHYKQTFIIPNNQLNALELPLKQNEVTNDSEFILKLSEFLEFVENEMPKYIIINNKDNEYILDKSLLDFINETIFQQKMAYSIKKIFILSDDPRVGNESNDTLEFCSEHKEIRMKLNK